MDNTAYNVFVPSYPMLLTDTWEGYKVQLGEPVITEEKPDSGDYYYHDGEYHVHPAGWEKSYIATFSAMTNLLIYGNLDGKQFAQAQELLLNKQGEFETRFVELQEKIKAEPSRQARQNIMTDADMEMAQEAHDLTLSIYQDNAADADYELNEKADSSGNGFSVTALIIILLLIAAAIAGFVYYRKRAE